MYVKAQLEQYEKIVFSITLRAPVEDWRAALRQLVALRRDGNIAWPLGGFVDCIERMLADLDKTHADVLIHEPDVI